MIVRVSESPGGDSTFTVPLNAFSATPRTLARSASGRPPRTTTQQAPLQRETRTHHPHGVEAGSSTTPGGQHARARTLAHGAQHLRGAVQVFEHLTEIVEQRETAIRREVYPAADRLHGELQAGARGAQRIAGLMDHYAGRSRGRFL